MYSLSTVLLTLVFSSLFVIIKSSLANEYCKFDEALKDKLRKISCEEDWYSCAIQARKIVQEYHSGSWGAVVVGNLEQIHKDWVEWNISRVVPDPPVCRLVVNGTVLIELFRTGYRTQDIKHDQVCLFKTILHVFCITGLCLYWIYFIKVNLQRNFILNEAKAPHTRGTTLNICPHAILRGIVSSFSVEQHSGRHIRLVYAILIFLCFKMEENSFDSYLLISVQF